MLAAIMAAVPHVLDLGKVALLLLKKKNRADERHRIHSLLMLCCVKNSFMLSLLFRAHYFNSCKE